MKIDFRGVEFGRKFIRKDLVLDLIDQEEVLTRYLGFKPNIGGEVISSPLRVDRDPSFGFFWRDIGNKPVIFYKDLAHGESGDIFIFLKKYLNKNTIYEVFIQLDYDFNLGLLPRNHNASSIIPNFVPTLDINNIHRRELKKDINIEFELQQFNLYDLNFWKQFGISPNTLLKFNVKSVKNYKLSDDFRIIYSDRSKPSMPIFMYSFNRRGTQFKLYNPYTSDKKRKFYLKGDASCVQGMEQLPSEISQQDFIFITKSLKDVMVLYELGYIAVAPQGEGMWMLDKQYDYLHALSNGNLILFYDNDEAGITASQSKSNKYNIPSIIIPEEYECKDISDFVKKYGKEEAKLLIESLI